MGNNENPMSDNPLIPDLAGVVVIAPPIPMFTNGPCPKPGPATILKWEPLGAGMCDVLVRHADGRELWCALRECRRIDGEPLPIRADVRRACDARAVEQLQSIRAQHVADFHKPWPGMDFAKTLFGQSVDAAIQTVQARR